MLGQRGEGDKEGVGQYDKQAELCGAQLGVGKAEFALQMGVDADIDDQ